MRSSTSVPTRQAAFDYDRPVIAFHGTREETAKRLVRGEAFDASTNDDDWLGHGIYFWEYAPQQAWWWAQRRYRRKDQPAVVGALVRLGNCLDLLDPSNANLLSWAHQDLTRQLGRAKLPVPRNANNHKFLDCAVFNWLYTLLEAGGKHLESCRAVFVPLQQGRGLPRMWQRSGVFEGAHIQLCVQQPQNILAVWRVRKDGRYGEG